MSEVNQNNTRKILGPATAYAMAVENGYVGTEEQFGQYLATAGTKAQETSQSASAAATSATNADNSAKTAEGYAAGTMNGIPISDTQSIFFENNAKYWAEQSASSAGEITGMTAQATTLSPGSSATASFANGVLTLGIPAGANGQDGDDGYSPTASVSKSGKVSTITITDKNGTTTAQVVDGTVDVETVSGTTPSITGVANTRYKCGEVSSISITPPQSGDIEVMFDSGTTAAVLTVPSGIKWPVWFDPTSLEASVTYDIIITDAEYGVVGLWA